MTACVRQRTDRRWPRRHRTVDAGLYYSILATDGELGPTPRLVPLSDVRPPLSALTAPKGFAMNTTSRSIWLNAGLASMLVLGACASTPVPTEQLAVTTAAVAQAVSVGGQELAPTEMGVARDKLVRAHLAVAAKDNDQALRLAQEAQVDAQLAGTKAEAAKARKAQAELDEAARVLREEMARKKP